MDVAQKLHKQVNRRTSLGLDDLKREYSIARIVGTNSWVCQSLDLCASYAFFYAVTYMERRIGYKSKAD